MTKQGYAQADSIITHTTNPLAKAAAKVGADQLKKETDKKAKQIIDEGNKNAQKVLDEAQKQADALRNNFRSSEMISEVNRSRIQMLPGVVFIMK